MRPWWGGWERRSAQLYRASVSGQRRRLLVVAGVGVAQRSPGAAGPGSATRPPGGALPAAHDIWAHHGGDSGGW